MRLQGCAIHFRFADKSAELLEAAFEGLDGFSGIEFDDGI